MNASSEQNSARPGNGAEQENPAPHGQSSGVGSLPPGSVPGRSVQINGVSYHVGEQGSGDRVVLLLHGMPDCSGVWRHQIPALVAAGYRVIAPDLLGYGCSDKPVDPARYAGDLLIADAVALMDSLGLDKVDVVGHDWGGFLSWELVLNLPQRFRRHVVFGTGHPDGFMAQQTPESARQNWFMYLNCLPSAAALYAANDGEFFKRVFVPSHPELDEVWNRMREPEAMLGMLNWDRGNHVADMYLAAATGQLPERQCEVPTLGVMGSDDEYLWESQLAESARSMAALWQYEAIPGASHWVMLDHPAASTRCILEWLAAEDSAPGNMHGEQR